MDYFSCIKESFLSFNSNIFKLSILKVFLVTCFINSIQACQYPCWLLSASEHHPQANPMTGSYGSISANNGLAQIKQTFDAIEYRRDNEKGQSKAYYVSRNEENRRNWVGHVRDQFTYFEARVDVKEKTLKIFYNSYTSNKSNSYRHNVNNMFYHSRKPQKDQSGKSSDESYEITKICIKKIFFNKTDKFFHSLKQKNKFLEKDFKTKKKRFGGGVETNVSFMQKDDLEKVSPKRKNRTSSSSQKSIKELNKKVSNDEKVLKKNEKNFKESSDETRDGELFLVADEKPGQKELRFSCLGFVRRGKNVFQMLESVAAKVSLYSMKAIYLNFFNFIGIFC